ncbi:MAG: 4-hydroxy-tetrahydrodipicolinate synthase [Firmicutes bacterium]|nr:4-hydroxy-tetrahydrodipicolinate synthase [Bacillota bacterium]
MQSRFGPVVTAMVTPFGADLEVDYNKAGKLAQRLVENGSAAVLVAGTTGESPTLTKEEKLKLFSAVLDAVGDKAKVIAGTGTNSTQASIELTRAAEKLGVHGALVVVPYYNKPPQEGLFQHFSAIASETSLPIMIYNIPGRTGVNMTAGTLARLASIPNIVAVKDSTGNLDQATEVRRKTPESFEIYSGDDSLTLPILSIGGSGVVSVASHIVGNEIRQMVDAYFAGKIQEAWRINARLYPVFKALFVTTNPIPVKFALKLSGFDVGGYRLPMIPPNDAEASAIKSALVEAGIISA